MEQKYNPFEVLEAHQQVILSRLEAIEQMLTSRPPATNRYYTVKEAAEKLKCSEITLYRQAKAGNVPSKRVGSRVMIPGSYVDK